MADSSRPGRTTGVGHRRPEKDQTLPAAPLRLVRTGSRFDYLEYELETQVPCGEVRGSVTTEMYDLAGRPATTTRETIGTRFATRRQPYRLWSTENAFRPVLELLTLFHEALRDAAAQRRRAELAEAEAASLKAELEKASRRPRA